ncbi:AzlC family ABC transporter permease [Ruania alba]|uniref:4-azaleucine resistance probable transporter AzlC n=1 Tax=Ruania alba TaxID=648782 RepID=A0A1H5M040_9MICO|nr:AzlC family ABC transporter permease [Ruania alba]SEE82689.1 4-azaleucine resistance probable transporter AzlC [Ruania alba]
MADSALRDPLVRGGVSMGLAVALIGIAYGALTVDGGLPVWLAPLLGVLVLAGASEMLFVGLAAGGTSPWLAMAAALLVNTRHLPYGMAVRRLLGTGFWRVVRTHVMNDESVAYGLAQRDPERARRAYTIAGLSVLVGWPVGALAGGLLGRVIDQNAWGLDAVFPAVILALLLPALRESRLRVPVLVAVVVSVAASAWAPTGLAPVLGLVALPLLLIRRWRDA